MITELLGRNLFQYHFICKSFHLDDPGIETGPPK
jgi:hypothetical protein